MVAFARFDDALEAIGLGQINYASINKVGTAPEAAGAFYSFWKDPGNPAAGANPAGGSGTPGAGGTAYDWTDGGLAKWPDVEPTQERVLLAAELQATVACQLIIYDRLVGVGGLSTASATTLNVNSVALPRYTDGEGVECWLEFSTATTATVGAYHLGSYTNSGGTGSRTGGAKSQPAAATNIGSMIQLPLQSGDYGIKSVETLVVDTASATGVVNLLLIKPLLTIPNLAVVGTPYDAIQDILRLPRIYDGATLGAMILASATTAVTLQGQLTAIYRDA